MKLQRSYFIFVRIFFFFISLFNFLIERVPFLQHVHTPEKPNKNSTHISLESIHIYHHEPYMNTTIDGIIRTAPKRKNAPGTVSIVFTYI